MTRYSRKMVAKIRALEAAPAAFEGDPDNFMRWLDGKPLLPGTIITFPDNGTRLGPCITLR